MAAAKSPAILAAVVEQPPRPAYTALASRPSRLGLTRRTPRFLVPQRVVLKNVVLKNLALTSLVLMGLVGCDEGGGDLRPWAPGDHDHAENAGQVAGTAVPGQENASLVRATWRNQCAQCHGPTGRGDGPQGRMLRVPDLNKSDWQSRATDATIANVIRRGRNKMPAFDKLPDDIVDGLVAHIRSFGTAATPQR